MIEGGESTALCLDGAMMAGLVTRGGRAKKR
jgi:hypothetical protein